MMLNRCCGADVHKASIVCCILVAGLNNEGRKDLRTFGTMTKDLLEMVDWLNANKVRDVAMESTGVYWKPVFNILEREGFNVLLANAQHIKNVPGRKTDIKDAQWIAELFSKGLLSTSFIPPLLIRELRTLTRSRRKLVEERSRVKNRIEKVLQTGNVKLSSVVSNIFGVSGRAMISALSENNHVSKDEIEQMAKGQLKNKIDELYLALEGRLTEANLFLLKQELNHLEFLEQQVEDFDAEIDRTMASLTKESETVQSLPGINLTGACAIISEIGIDMKRFPTEKHLASWAGICPGNNESAGKKKSGKTRRGNNYLKGILTECAWAASRTKNTAFSAFYHRLVRKKGKNRALVALAHKMIIEVYRVLKSGEPYIERGSEITVQYPKKAEEYLVRKLAKMGYTVQKIPSSA